MMKSVENDKTATKGDTMRDNQVMGTEINMATASGLPEAALGMNTTLIVPPAREIECDAEMLAKIAQLDNDEHTITAAVGT